MIGNDAWRDMNILTFIYEYLWPSICSILERIPVNLRRACILLLSDGKFCPCPLGLAAPMCYLCPVRNPSCSQLHVFMEKDIREHHLRPVSFEEFLPLPGKKEISSSIHSNLGPSHDLETTFKRSNILI